MFACGGDGSANGYARRQYLATSAVDAWRKVEGAFRGRMIVNTVAHVVKNNAATRVTIVARTGRVGSAATNMALSRRRADQVRDALIAASVPATRIDTRWTGENEQQVATSNDIDKPPSRVVDITVAQEMR